MKKYFFALSTIIVIMFSCKKEDNNEIISPTLKKIRNVWTVISARIFFQNGSNYLLLNDYQSFRSDNLQITKTFRFANWYYDTTKYNLLKDDSTILFYRIKNGVQDTNADTGYVRTISDNLFVYYFKNNGFINFVDSLKR